MNMAMPCNLPGLAHYTFWWLESLLYQEFFTDGGIVKNTTNAGVTTTMDSLKTGLIVLEESLILKEAISTRNFFRVQNFEDRFIYLPFQNQTSKSQQPQLRPRLELRRIAITEKVLSHQQKLPARSCVQD